LRCSIRSFMWDVFVPLIHALTGINIPKTVFAVSHRFWQVVFSFTWNSRDFLFPPSYLYNQWAVHFSASNYLNIFCCFFCCWVLVLLCYFNFLISVETFFVP
jgi:hypothetical protein